jgi:CheY-like chemotaxis protein
MADQSKTILVIEDSPVQAKSVGELLQGHGLSVYYAADGEVGVSIAQQHLPDAIVLDLEMPKMNGMEACKCLKADPRTAEIPIIILTNHADQPSMVIEGIERGAIDFIPKDSFAGAVLIETLRQLDVLPQTHRNGE